MATLALRSCREDLGRGGKSQTCLGKSFCFAEWLNPNGRCSGCRCASSRIQIAQNVRENKTWTSLEASVVDKAASEALDAQELDRISGDSQINSLSDDSELNTCVQRNVNERRAQ